MPRGDLFPEIGPFETGYLPLSDGHVMYWEQVGNPRGRPVLFLHGGPGAGAGAVHRRFFDPGHWRVAIFDQRGAGRSRPMGSLVQNTTADLVADIETLRIHFGVERWLLFGGSWGSTLALAYAQAHPDRVRGLVLRGVFLGRQEEVDWFLHGLAAVFPDAHAAFAGFLPESERGDLLGAYLRRLCDPDPAVHMPAARAWSVYEGSCSTLLPSPDTVTNFAQDRTALGLARIEAHYFAHGLFLRPGGLLAGMASIGHLPAEIVQGRYDMICPARSAFELAAAWPQARLTIVPDAGHSALEPGVRRALVATVERFRAAW
jgi:proline iminopeptidase